MKEKLKIGDIVKDENNNTGVICICWNDGDFVLIENDAAHPNPEICTENEKEKFLRWFQTQSRIRAIVG